MTDITKITDATLIAADKVKGADVYNLEGEKLGKIEDTMIDKVSGRAIYAVLSFGGFLGIGDDYYPLPWSTLRYDTSRGGYVVNLDKERLKGAPSYKATDPGFKWTPDYGRSVDTFYNAPMMWM
jgi:sporulation protein YlmC with PRC-barrel domain